MTKQEIIDNPPDITVRIGKSTIRIGHVCAVREEIPSVCFAHNGVFVTIQVAWPTLLRCINSNRDVRY